MIKGYDMTKNNLLHNDRILLFDGGMGSLLVKKGLLPGEKPEYWNLSHPDAIEEIHSAYITAGADIINTNTFGAYRHKLGDDTEKVILAAIENAKRAKDKAGKDTLIALDMGPLGKLLAPLGELDFVVTASSIYLCKSGALQSSFWVADFLRTPTLIFDDIKRALARALKPL